MDANTKEEIFTHLSSRKAWLVLIAYICFMIVLAIILPQFINRESLRTLVANSGYFGLFLFLLIEYIYIIFVPVYNTSIHLAAGYIFGGQLGWLLNFVATSAGLFTIIIIVKIYGRKILNKVVSEKILKKYDSLASRIGPMMLFVVYVLPTFPDDEITYLIAAGGNVRFWRFVLPVLLGNATKAAVSFIGDEGIQGFSMAIGTRFVVLIIGIIIIGFQEFLYHRSNLNKN